jgi:hypothetical protein
MTETRILGLLITDRIKESGRTQNILSNYARLISTRLGLHELNDMVCSRVGLIVIHLTGAVEEWDALEAELGRIEGLIVKKMSFQY